MNNIITIDTIADLPNSNIYYISDIDQYAIKINDIVYRGNIGNIYNKYDIKNNKMILNNLENNNTLNKPTCINMNRNIHENTNQIMYCKYGNLCNKLLHKPDVCNFYHDSFDVLQLYKNNIIDLQKFNLYKNTHKNFVNTNWMYVNSFKNNKNKNMRHFGSKNNLSYDLQILKINNNFKNVLEENPNQCKDDPNLSDVKNFKSQLIHDILVLNELKNNHLII
jgi:hypothetical protein